MYVYSAVKTAEPQSYFHKFSTGILPDDWRSDVFLSHSYGDILFYSSVYSVYTETSQQHKLLEVIQ